MAGLRLLSPNGWPASPLPDATPTASPPCAYGSRPELLARSSLSDSFIRCSKPVYPGAFSEKQFPSNNFALSGSGESIVLSAPDGQIVDSIDFGVQSTDVSDGRYADSESEVYFLSVPTPAAAKVLLRALEIRTLDGQAEFSFSTTPGRRYQVEGCDDLNDRIPLGGILTADDALFTWSEPVTLPRRFYRARLIP